VSSDRFATLRDVYGRAVARAPACRRIFEQAGLAPADLRSGADLARIPVFKKEWLLDAQRREPPFGGFLGEDASRVKRIYVSPGPILEPQFHGDRGGHGFDAAFGAAGLGPGDIVLNTWSYHLVPAGLLLDEGLLETGATVIPSGVGNTELQAQLVIDLGVTCICASTAFFVALIEQLEKSGRSLPADWKVRSAFLGGEFGDWMGKRRRLEARYGLKTFSAYATADFGIIGFESGGLEGYEIHAERIVQICDPVSGAPLPVGEPGEIVVTTLNASWPLIRFGTGDVAFATELHADGTVRRIGMLQGRVGQAVKAREIFVYPRQVEDMVIRCPGVVRAQAVVARPQAREEITLRLAVGEGADRAALEAGARAAFQTLSRLRADHVEFFAADGLAADAPLVVDRKDAARAC
jgi:phenylacetate-CoA ligase